MVIFRNISNIFRKFPHLAALIIWACFFTGCSKDNIRKMDAELHSFKILGPVESEQENQLISSGNGIVNILYATTDSKTSIIQTDNSGKILWKFAIPRQFFYPEIPVITTEADGGLSIFSGNHRYLVNADGKSYHTDSNFIKELEDYLISDVTINEKGNYVFWGEYPRSGPQNAFVAEFDRTGKRVFRSFSPSFYYYSGCEILADGSYLCYGNLKTIANAGKAYRLIISKFDKTGKLIFHKFIDTPEKSDASLKGGKFAGNIISTSNNLFAAACIPPNSNVYRLYVFNPDGIVLDTVSMKFKQIISLLDNRSSFTTGRGLCKKSNGGILSIINSVSGIYNGINAQNHIQPTSEAFYIEMDAELNIINNHPVDPYTSNIFFSLCNTSDNGIAALGSRISLNGTEKAILRIIQ